MKEIKAFGEIEDGDFIPRNPNVHMQELKNVGNVNECVMIISGKNSRTPDMHNYMFAMCNVIATRVNQDGWNFTAYDVYKKIEDEYCKDVMVNENTGREEEYIKPLKKQPKERYGEIITQARLDYMQRLNIHIKTPAEYYKLSERAYDMWKMGNINFGEARKMTGEPQVLSTN